MTLYIAATSFEERCVALPEQMPSAGSSDRVFLIDFTGYENVAPYLFNRARVLSTLREKGYKVVRVQADVGCPLEAFSRIEADLSTSPSGDVLLDISSLPRNYLFGICRLLATTGTPTNVRYYRPLEYGSELSRGVRSVEAIPGFEGDVGPTKETVLAVILGFEGYKALHAWERIGPSSVIALYGDPPYEAAFLAMSKRKNGDFIEQVGEVSEGTLHTYDVLAAKSQLESIYNDVSASEPDSSFILCPLGTKLQSLAAFAFAYNHEAVAVAYVSSLSYYTENYSRGYEPEYTEISLADLIKS